MSESKFIGVIRRGELEVEVDKDTFGHYTFSAVGREALPLAADLAELQAMSFRNFKLPSIDYYQEASEARWEKLLDTLRAMEQRG